jgi:hypothetical protein
MRDAKPSTDGPFFTSVLRKYIGFYFSFQSEPACSTVKVRVLPLHADCYSIGAAGQGIALKAGRSRVRFPMVSLEFFIDIILPAALWTWGRHRLERK